MSKVVFFGNERLIQGLKHTDTPTLRTLYGTDHEVVAIVSHNSESRSRNSRELEVAKLAEEYGTPVLLPEKPTEIYDELKNLGADIGVLVAYGRIVPQVIIDLFPHGIINVHPSLLPKYRGPSPVESAISNGDGETGVSIMSLSAGMDSGPVYVQEKISLDGIETAVTLCEKASNLGAKLIANNLDKIISGELKPTEQNEAEATYCQMIKKTDGNLDPSTMTAIECDRKIRAYIAYPKSRIPFPTRHSGLDPESSQIIVTAAKVLPDFTGDDWPDVIRCADETYLRITEIVSPNSGKTMKISDYLNGLK
jgi:methionyl-tRNA formyltransferase